ncbi:MAG: twin transmembrane helix small protein [Alphaproteobacteria bacterium]|nr:twin transmembrane helix small protein [Alphaproteobacteria bacterium]
MSSFSALLAVIAMVLVVVALFIGLFSMAKGGEFNKKYGNKLMQARVILQGIALAFIAIAYFASQGS